MDRTQAFAEYGRILQDGLDWLDGGYRRVRGESPVVPPAMHLKEPTAATGPAAAGFPEARGAGAGPPVFNPGNPETVPEAAGAYAPASDAAGSRIGPAAEPEAPVGGAGRAGTGVPTAAPPRDGAAQPSPSPTNPREPAVPNPVPVAPGTGELADIAGEIADCRNCNLYLLRENTVPGVGSSRATLMVVTPPPADAAGADDSPLPAYEGEYLGRWLTALGLDVAGDVFITPAVKCRTPGARPPQAEEAAACAGYLRRQYKTISPRAILALGAAACGQLTGDPADFPALVGRDWTWGAVPALVLWTPAEVLADPARLRKPVWDALQRLKAAWNAVPGTPV